MTPIPTLLSMILAGENSTRKDPQRQIKKTTTVYISLNGLVLIIFAEREWSSLRSKFTYRSSVTDYSLRDTSGKLAVPLILIPSFLPSFIHSFIRFSLSLQKNSEILVGNFRSVRTYVSFTHLPKISGLSRRARLNSSYNMTQETCKW